MTSSELIQLAEFLTDIDIRRLPSTVVECARLHVLDSLAASIAGYRSEIARVLKQEQTDNPSWQALAGAALAHCHEADDIFDEALLCIGGLVVSTAVAVGAAHQASGAEVLAAVVAGYEAMGRIGLAINSASLLQRGWWPTATCGAFGSAAVAAHLLKLDKISTANALALAGQNTGGISGGEEGGLGRNLLYGNIARVGILSAEAAATGLTGPLRLLSMPRGIGSAYGVHANLARLIDGLGEQFIVSRTSFKPYACARQLHTAVEMALKWRADGPDTADINEIVIELPPESAFVNRPSTEGWPSMKTGSAQWVLSLALNRGHVLPADFSTEILASPDVKRLAERVRVQVCAPGTREPFSAALTIHSKHGSLRQEMQAPRGSPARPLAPAEVAEKAVAITESALGAKSARLVALATRIDELPSVDELARLQMGK